MFSKGWRAFIFLRHVRVNISSPGEVGWVTKFHWLLVILLYTNISEGFEKEKYYSCFTMQNNKANKNYLNPSFTENGNFRFQHLIDLILFSQFEL